MSLVTGCQWPRSGTYTDAARGTGGDSRGIEETDLGSVKEWTVPQVSREPF